MPAISAAPSLLLSITSWRFSSAVLPKPTFLVTAFCINGWRSLSRASFSMPSCLSNLAYSGVPSLAFSSCASLLRISFLTAAKFLDFVPISTVRSVVTPRSSGAPLASTSSLTTTGFTSWRTYAAASPFSNAFCPETRFSAILFSKSAAALASASSNLPRVACEKAWSTSPFASLSSSTFFKRLRVRFTKASLFSRARTISLSVTLSSRCLISSINACSSFRVCSNFVSCFS